MGKVEISLKTSGDYVAGLQALQRAYDQKLLRRVARDVLPPISRAFDRTVRRYPPPRNPAIRFVWSRDPAANTRARRWWFANRDGAHVRTGDLGDAWETDLYLLGGEIITDVSNDSRGASYVYGSEDHGQVPGHVTTGWQPITETIGQYAEATEDALLEVFVDVLADAIEIG